MHYERRLQFPQQHSMHYYIIQQLPLRQQWLIQQQL
jgi:hypothetical protein